MNLAIVDHLLTATRSGHKRRDLSRLVMPALDQLSGDMRGQRGSQRST
jgi:hypothetical protein